MNRSASSYFLILSLFLFAVSPVVFASTTNGTIDSTSKYAWGENAGWLNFGTTGGNIHVTDSALTGYIWSQNYGWINLSPAGSGVTNNSEGTLSGSAWGENLGYIGFTGVTINSSGIFTGTASGTVAGRINFDCTNCSVKTDWRPASTRSSGSSGGSSGGGGAPAESFVKPQEPLSVIINNGTPYTTSAEVTLTLSAGPNVVKMAISNFEDFHDAGQETFSATKQWKLCDNCTQGFYKVYAKFYTSYGQPSDPVSATILYTRNQEVIKEIEKVRENELSGFASILESIRRRLEELFPSIFPPRPPGNVGIPPIEERVPREPQVAFRAAWNLLPVREIHQFVFEPLPQEIAKLTEKFPSLEKLFSEVGVKRQSDLEKLHGIGLQIPGVGKNLGLVPPELGPKPFLIPPGIPIANLGADLKKKLPTEVVFARGAGERIDFDIKLKLTDQGKLEKRIHTVAGSLLTLAVKPEAPAESVKGYLLFRSRTTELGKAEVSLRESLASVFTSTKLAFSEPASQIAYDAQIENRLSLLSFDYTDPDHDGIYTAEIRTPLVTGEYDVITVIRYKDIELGAREVRLTAVVDPEGYVYENVGGKQLRIPGAIVSLYRVSADGSKYELWPAKDYAQENPQVTDVRGTYAFLVPQGTYMLKVEVPGYLPFEGKPFIVDASNEVHSNIELRTKYWYLRAVDWKTVLLVLVILLLVYNFWRDRKRERLDIPKIPDSLPPSMNSPPN